MANGVRVLTAHLADLDDPRGPLWPLIVALCVAAQLALLHSHQDFGRRFRSPEPRVSRLESEDADEVRREAA
jgi:hypothetical protein